MEDELELDFLNLEFRIMLWEERCKEIRQQMEELQLAIEKARADLLSSGDEDYWRAEDA